jgi:hypothetical protein
MNPGCYDVGRSSGDIRLGGLLLQYAAVGIYSVATLWKITDIESKYFPIVECTQAWGLPRASISWQCQTRLTDRSVASLDRSG